MHYVYYFKARIKKKKNSDRILFVIFDYSSFSSSVDNWVVEIELELTNSSWRKDNSFIDTTNQCITQYGVIDS